MSKFIIYTDGGARGNPGPGAAAFVIQDEKGRTLVEDGRYLGSVTNNQAEYQAVLLALNKLADSYQGQLPATIDLRADSLLVINQLAGKYKIKNQQLKAIVEQIKDLYSQVGQVSFKHIARAENYQADKLVNNILDLQGLR